MLEEIKGLKKITDCSMPTDEKERIEKAECAAYNEAINDVIKVLDLHDITDCLLIDSPEFKTWQKDNGISRIEGTNCYQWKCFKYERPFFLGKFSEDSNKAND